MGMKLFVGRKTKSILQRVKKEIEIQTTFITLKENNFL